VPGRHLTRRNRILYRIILPFTVLFTVTSVISWLFSANFIARHMEASLKQQMEQVADLVARTGYILNPGILHHLKHVLNSEIVLFDRNGQVFATTFPAPVDENLYQGVAQSSTPPAPFVGKDVEYRGVHYRTVLHPVVLPIQGQAILSIWTPVVEADRLRGNIVLALGAASVIGILAMAAAGYFIARTITAPLEELVKVTETVAGGDRQRRALVRSPDEIGVLAQAFNEMIEKLGTYEDRLVETEKIAAAAQLAAGLAHEIRNPLTSIKMLGQVLRGRLKDQDENQQMLDSMVQEINRLDRIIQEMINRTKPGELQLERNDLIQPVKEVVGLAKENLAAWDISIECHLDSRLPQVYMDREKIKQVLWNLILNARDAMPGGGSIVISTRNGDNDTVMITVDDSGSGIGDADAERLFQPFYTAKPEGMGLGLAISRKIVEKHGGSLSLENRPDIGTRAKVVLPVRP
jgi:signal transduction histidine kinase